MAVRRIGTIALFIPALCRAQSYTITTVAGGGPESFPGLGDGGPATSAYLATPLGVAVDAAGNLYIADSVLGVIRKVAPGGTISLFAGQFLIGGYSGDGGPATSAELAFPNGIALDSVGNLYIADKVNNRIRKVDTKGTITTVAGGGAPIPPSIGDGGPATQAMLGEPLDVAVDGSGNIYIADFGNFRVRKVATNGIITTVAGGGVITTLGDGGPATSAYLKGPSAVAVDAVGNLYIADEFDNRIRKVATNGIITTVAGSGAGSYAGDGGPATQAGIDQPQGVAVDAAGNLYIADTSDDRIRMVTPAGTIGTIAGKGSVGYSGDGGPADDAAMNQPVGIALAKSGALYVADSQNSVVRLLTPNTQITGAPPFVNPGGVVSASAFGEFGSVAPGSWIEIYGSNLAPTRAPGPETISTA
jgi:sugar lactone lactonase YvrE